MNVLKLLVLSIFIVFPFGELLRLEIGNNIVLKPIDILTGLTMAYWVFTNLTHKRYIKNNLLTYATFPIIGFIALLINTGWLKPNELFVSFLYLIRWISYFALYFIISQFDVKFKKKIINFLLISGLIIVLLGYLQYFFFNSLKDLYYLGWDEHMHRIFSVFLDPNYAGGFFVLYFIFTGGIYYKSITGIQKSNKNKKYVFGLILGLTLIAIFLSFSRSALLMLIAGSVTFFILVNRIKLILVILAAILLFGISVSPMFYDENMNLFRTSSTNARLMNDAAALKIIKDHPLIGVGFNSYRYTKDLYGLDHDWVKAPSHADAGVDNSFLFILATTGIIGFSLYLILWSQLIKTAWLQYKKNLSIYSIISISSAAGLFINALFINSLFFPYIMLWMWGIFGVIDLTER